MVLQLPSRRHLPWLALSLALMFMAAYSAIRAVAVVGPVSALRGIPDYVEEIPRLQRKAALWGRVALVLPLFAAFALAFGLPTAVSDEPGSQGFGVHLRRYALWLAISVLGTFCCALCLLLVGWLDYLYLEYKRVHGP